MEPSLLSGRALGENVRERGGQLESVLLLKSISMLPNTISRLDQTVWRFECVGQTPTDSVVTAFLVAY